VPLRSARVTLLRPVDFIVRRIGTALHQIDEPRIWRVRGERRRWSLVSTLRRFLRIAIIGHVAHPTLTAAAVRRDATPRLAIEHLSRQALSRRIARDLLTISIWLSSKASFVNDSSEER
jgi:hypothetical protein